VDPAKRRPANSPKRSPVPSRQSTWSHQNNGKRASSRPASSGLSVRRLASANTRSGSTRRLWGGDPADRVGRDGAFILGKLQDAKQDRAAGHQAPVTKLARELVLPLADQRRLDGLQGPLAEPGSDMASQPVFGCSQGGWAAIGVGDDTAHHSSAHRSKVSRPRRRPFPCLGRRSNGLGALGAVVQEPPDLVGNAASVAADPLADAYRRHRPRPPTSCPAAPSAHRPARPPIASTPIRASGSPMAAGRLLAAGSCRTRV
jgi:hypothetical protein